MSESLSLRPASSNHNRIQRRVTLSKIKLIHNDLDAPQKESKQNEILKIVSNILNKIESQYPCNFLVVFKVRFLLRPSSERMKKNSC